MTLTLCSVCSLESCQINKDNVAACWRKNTIWPCQKWHWVTLLELKWEMLTKRWAAAKNGQEKKAEMTEICANTFSKVFEGQNKLERHVHWQVCVGGRIHLGDLLMFHLVGSKPPMNFPWLSIIESGPFHEVWSISQMFYTCTCLFIYTLTLSQHVITSPCWNVFVQHNDLRNTVVSDTFKQSFQLIKHMLPNVAHASHSMRILKVLEKHQ